jgi:RND family efflux transporter MFP subunit
MALDLTEYIPGQSSALFFREDSMKWVWRVGFFLCGVICVVAMQSDVFSEGNDKPEILARVGSDSEPQMPPLDGSGFGPQDLNIISRPDRINAIIYPLQSATIATEVRGLIDFIRFKEGEPVKQGDVISEISRARYEAIVGEFKGNYDAVVRTLDRAKEEVTIQEELYAKRAGTLDDLSKAKAQVRVLEARKYEAEHKLKQADLNLQACIIRAPFTGNMAVLYHEPFEVVDNLEKLFGLVDTSKVYARVNWPEARLAEVAVGKKAQFQYDGKAYEGVIEKISSLIDPASKSKRVHVLIDNSAGKLQVGMSGSLQLIDGKKVSLDSSAD